MITIEERRCKKLSGFTSLFFSFFNQDIINRLNYLTNTYIGKNLVPLLKYNENTKEYEIPIFYLSQLVEEFSKYDDVELKYYENAQKPPLEKRNFDYRVKLFDYQKEALEYGLCNNKWLLLDEQGLGKALTLETPVLTINGFKPMKDVSIGDTLFDEQGHKCRVIATYNHKDLEMYRITFSDGTFVECCKDHLWQVNYRKSVWKYSDTAKNNRICQPTKTDAVKTTEWIATHNYKKMRIEIPICQPVEFSKKDLPLHPYVLGCLLGDGALSDTQHGSVSFTSMDKEIIDKFSRLLPNEYALKFESKCGKASTFVIVIKNPHNRKKTPSFSKLINDLGLGGTTSKTKFIPEIYKMSTIKDRQELLCGMIDTDGYVGKLNYERQGNVKTPYTGVFQYTTTSSRLLDDFKEVVESLGGVVKTHTKRHTICYNSKVGIKDCGESYTGTIQIANPLSLCSLARKRGRLRKRKSNVTRVIKKVERIDNAPGKCITVDSSSHLYVIKDYIVTHNTSVMIHLAEELYKRGEIEHCFIVCCVNSLKANWKKEIAKHSELGLGCKVLGERISSRGNIINGSVKDRIKDLTTPIDELFIITNIETLRSDEFIKTYNSKKNKNKIDMIVVDEIHKASNSSSDQGKGLLKLKAKYQVALTGTLLTNSPLSAYLPLKWIGEEKGNKGTCKAEYCVYRGYGDAVLLAGYKNLDAFKEEIDNCSLRRTKEVLKDELPPKTILEEYVSLSDSHRKFYEEVKNGVKDSCDKVNLDTNQTLSLITRLRQATGCPSVLTTENITSSKLERAVELAQDLISSGEKVVIFSTFKESVYKLAEMLKENNPLICTGDSKDEEISVNIDKFQNDDEHYLLIGTHQKMGTGVTLNRASYMIFIDTPFTYSDYAQACDRIHRIGSKNPVFIYNLICEDTIDEKVNDIVMTKKDLSDYVIDNENLTNRLRRMLLEL